MLPSVYVYTAAVLCVRVVYDTILMISRSEHVCVCVSRARELYAY